jgi:hypothetical protein
MRTARTVLTALLLFGALSLPATAQLPAPGLPQAATYAAIGVGVGVGFHGAVGVDFFYSNLAPYGYWIDRPSYGWVWVPRHVRHHWRPYSYGRWVYSDYGWTWVSSEPFGWATYHYGRWYNDPDYGYEWVPGTDWGPAWVSWQQGDGYLGWAALPPEVGWNAGVGLAYGGIDLSIGLAPHYCFVPERNFLAANVGTFIVPPERNLTIIRNTTNITNMTVQGGRVFNGGMAVDRIQQVTGQPVRQFQLAAASDPRTVRVSGNTVAMFRPTSVVRRANTPDPPHVAPRAVATGRVAEQLRQERHSMAAQAQAQVHQQGGERGAQAQVQQRGGARGAPAQAQRQSVAGRQQYQARGKATPQRQYQARGQAAPRRQQSTAPGRQAHQQPSRQMTPPPQRTRGGTPPRRGERAQQVHQYVPPSQQARRQAAPQQRQPQQVQRSAPPPQSQRQSAAPQQFRRQSAPPPQRQPQAVQRQAPPQRQAQAAPPQRQPQARQQPPQRQARAQAQPQRRQQPPPGGGR